MALPTLSGVARLVDDPELRFTPSGAAVASMRLAFNSRRKNEQTGEWEDADVFWVKATAWRHLAENCAESLAKGMEITVTGELRTESWTDQDGGKRSAPALQLRSIGPNLAFAVCRVSKASSNGPDGPARSQAPQQSQQQPRGRQSAAQGPAHDPWATTPEATPQGGTAWGNQAQSDEPPF